MLLTIRPFLFLLISSFILMTGFGLSNILLPVRMQHDNVSVDDIGLVLSVYSVGFLIGSYYSRILLQRVGHIRIFAMCGSLTSVAILISGLFPDPYVLGLMRILTGFCMACTYATLDSWLSYSATEENRGRILSINQIVTMSALFLGQFLLNIAPIDTITLFVISGILFSLAITPIVISKQIGPVLADSTSMSFMTIIKLSPLGVVCCFYCGVFYSALFNMLPVVASAHGITGLNLSIFMGSAIIGGIILQFPIAYLSDHFDRRKVMLGMMIMLIIASILAALFIALNLFYLVLLTIALITGIVACLYPMSMSETFDKVVKEQILSAMGSLLFIYALGSIGGPYLASIAMKLFGESALFGFIVFFAITLLVFILFRMKQRIALSPQEQEHFVMQTPSSSIADLDPRIDYVEPVFEQNDEVDVAVSLATKNPGIAVNMAKAIVLKNPENAAHIVAALSLVDEINIGKLYSAITTAAPKMAIHFAEVLTTASPEQAEELIDWLTTDHPEELSNIIVAIANAMPDNGIGVMEFAAEHMSDEDPKVLLEMTEQYMTEFSDSLDEMRPVDRNAADSEQTATDLYNRLSDISPEYSAELALAVSEALPESSNMVAQAYVNNLIESENESENDNEQHNDETVENIETAVNEYLAQVIENIPEFAVDVASTIVDSVPDVASDVVELLQDADAVAFDELSASVDDKPEEDLLDKQLSDAVQTQTDSLNQD